MGTKFSKHHVEIPVFADEEVKSRDQKPLDRLLIEGYIHQYIFKFERIDFPFDITNSILLYYYKPYEILRFNPNYASKRLVLQNHNKLAQNSSDADKHYYVLGNSRTTESVWRFNVCRLLFKKICRIQDDY